MNKRALILLVIFILLSILAFFDYTHRKKILPIIQTSWQQARVYNNRACDYIDAGKYDEAISEAKEALKLDPKYANAYANLGGAYKEKGLFDNAIKACQEALKINPNSFDAHNNLGAALYCKGQIDEAIKSYRKALSLNPNNVTTHKNLAFTYFEKGLFDNAEKELDEVKRLTVEDASFLKESEWDKKVEALQAKTNSDTNNARAYYLLGEIYYELKLYNLAINNFQKSIEVSSRYTGFDYDIVSAYNNLGASYIQKGILDEAIKWYKKAVEISTSSYISFYGLGVAYWRIGKYDEAIKACEESFKINPDYTIAQYIIGICYEKKKTFKEAIKTYEWILTNAPNSHKLFNINYIFLHLAEGYNNIGVKDKAEEMVNKFQKSFSYLDWRRDLSIISISKVMAKLKIYDKEVKTEDEVRKILREKYLEFAEDKYFDRKKSEELFYVANLYLTADLIDEATKLIKKARMIGADYANTSFSLGVIYLHKGLFTEAINEFYKTMRMEYPYNNLYWIYDALFLKEDKVYADN